MTGERRRSAIHVGALALGIALFAATLCYIDISMARDTIRRLGVALPAAMLISGLWHLTRTFAWAACFPHPRRVGFLHLARVRLSAEAISYLTVRGIAGEPLKVLLLSDAVAASDAGVAVALERIAYIVSTMVIIGITALLALLLLPLTGGWFHVFCAFAVLSATVPLLIVRVVCGRRAYLQSPLRRMDRLLGTSLASGRVAAFADAAEHQMLDLVRGNPMRLVTLVAATVASHLFMSLEAWVILRAAGAPISANGALAVETFSRVASFASAVIPANLGALEASSVAAVMAVGAVGGGPALALARRLRGLFWAGVGLAIYPRRRSVVRTIDATKEGRPVTLFYFPCDPSVSVPASARLAGLPIAERIVRAAIRAGYSRIVIWAPDAAAEPATMKRLRRLRDERGSRVELATVPHEWDSAVESLPPADGVTVVGAGTVVSPALLARAREVPASSGRTIDVVAGPAWPESGVVRMTAGDARDRTLVGEELAARRTRALPLPSGIDVSNGVAQLAIRVIEPADLAAGERTIRRAVYKDTDGVVAQWNRRMSLPISVALIPTLVTANQLSIILVAVGFYAAWLFSLGHYWTGLLAGFLSLAASVLDGSDGEIARLKYQESALGCWIETFGDYSYYVAIFIGVTIGVVRQTHWDLFYWVGGLALGGTLFSFAILIYLRSRITGGKPEKLNAMAQARFIAEPTLFSRIMLKLSFVATRAAMPYGIMAFAIASALPLFLVLAVIAANCYWISLVLKMRQLLGSVEAVAAA